MEVKSEHLGQRQMKAILQPDLSNSPWELEPSLIRLFTIKWSWKTQMKEMSQRSYSYKDRVKYYPGFPH